MTVSLGQPMATHTLNLRLDRSVPYNRLTIFSRFWRWDDAEKLTTPDRSLSLQIVTPEEFANISPRWDTVYPYGFTSETDMEGKPVFDGFPTGTTPVEPGTLDCPLDPGVNYILIERLGGILRDYRAGEPVIGSSVWSKAKLSGYLIVTVEG